MSSTTRTIRWNPTEEQSAEVLRQARRLSWECIDPDHAEVLFYLGNSQFSDSAPKTWLAVIGHPDYGSYEWIAYGFRRDDLESKEPGIFRSDDGWGGIVSALRELLVTMED